MTYTNDFPAEYYTVFRHFGSQGWGRVTDGPADHNDMLEYVAEVLEQEDPGNLLIHRVNTEDGVSRDETCDILEQFFSEDTGEDDDDEDTHSYMFQYREAKLAGHFS